MLQDILLMHGNKWLLQISASRLVGGAYANLYNLLLKFINLQGIIRHKNTTYEKFNDPLSGITWVSWYQDCQEH